MKLNKLLPIATIASVAAAVTPLVTSCSNGSQIEWNYVKNGTYSSKVEQAHMTKYYENIAEIEKLYFNDISNNHMIVADDLLCSKNSEPLYFVEGSQDGKTNKMIISAECISVNKDKKELSLKFKCSIDTLYYLDDNAHYKMEIEGTVKNLKYELKESNEVNEGTAFNWELCASYSLEEGEEKQIQYLTNDKDWSASAKAYIYYDSDVAVEPYEANDECSANSSNIKKLIEDCEKEGREPAVMQLLPQVAQIGSHYLDMLELKEE